MPRIDAALSPLADASLPVVDARPGPDAFVSPLACGAPETLGGSCRLGGCIPRWGCTTEQSYEEPSVRRDGTPGRSYPVRTSIGGQCRGSCDPEIEASCPSCASCVESQLAPVHECLARCVPEVSGRGGCRDGYACDRARAVCVDACDVVGDVDTCQFTFEDRDAVPGRETIVDEGVEYPSRCDLVTGLCVTTGRIDATAGDDCTTDLDCEDDGTCVRAEAGDPPSALDDGYCVRRGCNDTDLPCREGDTCARTVFDLPGGVCLEGCSVGAETTDAERLGAAGRNPGCEAGEACFWDGVHAQADATNGACWPGNYNEVSTYNVGAPCTSDAQCFSPFGLGRCLFVDSEYVPARAVGVCAIAGCGLAADGTIGLLTADGVAPVPSPELLCDVPLGGRDACLGFTPRDTFCIASCLSAADCPTGYACPELGALRVCWPTCARSVDCREGASCLDEAGGSCEPDRETCVCSDALPLDEADAGAGDAGTADDVGSSEAADAGVAEGDAALEDAGLDAP